MINEYSLIVIIDSHKQYIKYNLSCSWDKTKWIGNERKNYYQNFTSAFIAKDKTILMMTI